MTASPPSKRPRVMLANLGPIARVGMLRLLSEDGIEVIGDQLMPASITPEIERLRPDVVVIDLDQTESQQLCELVRSVWPHTKVVLWASTEDVMEVIDPGATKPRWVLSGVPEDLLAEVSSLQVTPAEE